MIIVRKRVTVVQFQILLCIAKFILCQHKFSLFIVYKVTSEYVQYHAQYVFYIENIIASFPIKPHGSFIEYLNWTSVTQNCKLEISKLSTFLLLIMLLPHNARRYFRKMYTYCATQYNNVCQLLLYIYKERIIQIITCSMSHLCFVWYPCAKNINNWSKNYDVCVWAYLSEH